VAMRSLQMALRRLPAEHREALILVGAAGLSYEEAAEICGCALGTIKSRVNRARARLLKIMDAHDATDAMALDPTVFGPTRTTGTRSAYLASSG